MGLTAALTAAQLTTIRRVHWSGNQHISLCPNTVVFRAQINDASMDDVQASLEYDNVSVGAIGDVEEGMTVFVSPTTDPADAVWRGRVRANDAGSVGDADTIYINETTTGEFDDDDYIIVIEDYAIHPVLARYDSSAGVQYKDYDHSFEQLRPVIGDVQSAYAGWVDATGVYTVAFAATAVGATDGAAVNSYAWSFPAGSGSVTAGAINTANVTYAFNPGNWWCSLPVTDDGGRSQTVHFFVFALGEAGSPPASGFTGADIECNLDTGWTATVDAFDGVEAVLDNTLVVIWSDEYYGTPSSDADVHRHIIDAVKCVGRLRTETDVTEPDAVHSLLSSVRFTIEGPTAQMARMAMQMITMVDDSTPTAWDEIDKLTPWREIVHVLQTHSTFFNCHTLTFESVGDGNDDTYRERIITNRSVNLLESIRRLAFGINGVFEMDAQGRARFSRDARYLTTAQRAALTTVANLGTQDHFGFDISHDHVVRVGRVDASGGSYNTTTTEIIPRLSRAPGEAQGTGADSAGLHNQVLEANLTESEAQTARNARCGHHLAASNPTDVLRAALLPGWHFLTPSRAQWFTWTIEDYAVYTYRRTFDTDDRWLLVSLSCAHDNAAGTRTVSATFELETSGVPGVDVISDAETPGSVPWDYPFTPPFTTFSSFPEDDSLFIPSGGGEDDVPPGYGGNPNAPGGPESPPTSWTNTFDFSDTCPDGWTVLDGVCTTDEGIVADFDAGRWSRITVYHTFSLTTITRVRVKYYLQLNYCMSPPDLDDLSIVYRDADNVQGTILAYPDMDDTAGHHTATWTGSINAQRIQLFFSDDRNTCGSTYNRIVLYEVQISGLGSTPF